MLGDNASDLIDAYAWLQRTTEGGEEIEQALRQVVDRLTLDEFAAARRRYLELAGAR